MSNKPNKYWKAPYNRAKRPVRNKGDKPDIVTSDYFFITRTIEYSNGEYKILHYDMPYTLPIKTIYFDFANLNVINQWNPYGYRAYRVSTDFDMYRKYRDQVVNPNVKIIYIMLYKSDVEATYDKDIAIKSCADAVLVAYTRLFRPSIDVRKKVGDIYCASYEESVRTYSLTGKFLGNVDVYDLFDAEIVSSASSINVLAKDVSMPLCGQFFKPEYLELSAFVERLLTNKNNYYIIKGGIL
jgi:hypothetical protein